MVNNFKRIHDEIKREANRVASGSQLRSESLVDVIMEIVNIEDQNRIKVEPRINQRIKGIIQDALETESQGDA